MVFLPGLGYTPSEPRTSRTYCKSGITHDYFRSVFVNFVDKTAPWYHLGVRCYKMAMILQ